MSQIKKEISQEIIQFIDYKEIEQLIESSTTATKEEIHEILNKAKLLKGLTRKEAAALIAISEESLLQELFNTALEIKKAIYGSRLVLFAPLYVSNFCSNNCLYCGFRKDNKTLNRSCLTIAEVKEETKAILEQGHKRVLMLMGEDESTCSFDYFLDSIDACYSVKDSKNNSIRRINVEIAPLTNEQFKKLAQKKIGTYTVFQETYHPITYKKMHPSGKKADYNWRLYAMDRALQNGLHDVGIGALFGLHDYRFEVVALLTHANHLDKTYGVGPHTISIPRIEPAPNAPCANNIPAPVSDTELKKIVAVLRCAVPYTGIILSTRESAEMRKQLLDLGVSQMSAGSKTNPGGYHHNTNDASPIEKNKNQNDIQFKVNDNRSTDEVIASVIKQGYIPSFCTGCYRLGRVGGDFMDLAKPGLIQLHCHPNALLTLKEYLNDYATPDTKKAGEELIKKQISEIPTKDRQEKTKKYLSQINEGKRDIYF